MRPDRFEDRLLDYVDGRMNAADRAAFEAWLREHPAEARRVRQHQQVDQLLGELEGEEWSGGERADFAAQVVSRARSAAEAPVLAGPAPARHRRLAAWVAAAVVVVAVWALWPDRRAETPGTTPVDELAAPADLETLLADPEFVAHFDLLQHMEQLEEAGVVLDLPEDDTFDVVNLEVLAGV